MKVLEKILFAGFGGQGVLSIGKIFADACIENDMQASWLPSYGPEMRGGTCNCLVAVSNEPVLSPYFVRPTDAIIMNQDGALFEDPRHRQGGGDQHLARGVDV